MTLPAGLAQMLFAQTRAAEEEAGRIYDAVVGLVTDIKDPQELCRVKVRFPSLGPDATWWCPVVAPGAGKDRGWFTVPEVEDEVLVMFEHGDVARPVILGALWNGKDRPPDDNADGKNARRVIKSKTGHKVTFDDDEQRIMIEDGAGIGSVTIDGKTNTIELLAKQGDVAIQAKDEVSIFAGEIVITARGACDLHGKAGGVNASAAAAIKIAGSLVALKGSTIDVNPGGVEKAAKASGTVAEVPDGNPGSGAEAAGGGAQGAAGVAGSGTRAGGGRGGRTDGGGAAAAPAAARRPGPTASADPASTEPAPALLAAGWAQARAKAGEQVALTAMCLELAGQAATFEIRPAGGGALIGTVRGTCGETNVDTVWTTPVDARSAQFVFTVRAGEHEADSDVLTLVAPFTATLVYDDLPAFGVEVELESIETGERLGAAGDREGRVEIPEAPIGGWRLHLKE